MSSGIIVRRRLPVYEFLCVTAMDPEAALSHLALALRDFSAVHINHGSRPAELVDGRLDIRALRVWSLHPHVTARSVASVAGSNVYVSLRVSLFWRLLLVALLLTLLVLFLAPAPGHPTTPFSLLMVTMTVVAVGGVLAGLSQAASTVVFALTDPSSSGSVVSSSMDEDAPRSRLPTILAGVVLTVVALVIAFPFGRHFSRQLGDERLMHAAFAPDTTRQEVIDRLGPPELELSGNQFRAENLSFDPACLTQAGNVFFYFTHSMATANYCVVYFDGEGRVTCVQHGKMS
jgi:hypothetical protein